jgi:hypothetical protein
MLKNNEGKKMKKYLVKKIENNHYAFVINPDANGDFQDYYEIKLESTWVNYPYIKSKVHRIFKLVNDELKQVKIINNLDKVLPVQKIVDELYSINKKEIQ